MSAKINDFAGNYKRVGNSYIKKQTIGVLKMIIGHRKQAKKPKPKDFILFTNGISRPQYWSSLYPTSTCSIFEAEYQGTFYLVEVNEKSIDVIERDNI